MLTSVKAFSVMVTSGALLLTVIGAGYPSMRTDPRPPSGTLGRPPNNCAPGPLPEQFSPSFGLGLGNSRFRMIGSEWDVATYMRLRLSSHERHGWYIKIIWAIPRSSTQDVRVRMWNLATGRAVTFFAQTGTGPTITYTTVNVLSRNHAGEEPGDWIESGFHGTIFPSAGCYALFAQWKGGAYLASLAAGR